MLGFAKSDRVFYDSFERHAACVVKAARLLAESFDRIGDAADFARQIEEVEHAGDRITHETLSHLHKTWITPLDRSQVQRLISTLDDVVDLVEAISERVVLFEIATVPDNAREIARYLVLSCEAVEQAVKLLPNLKHPERLLELCVEINRLENAGDRAYRHALAELYRAQPPRGDAPNSIFPAEEWLAVPKWRDIYDNLETACDRCEDIANILEGVVLEYG